MADLTPEALAAKLRLAYDRLDELAPAHAALTAERDRYIAELHAVRQELAGSESARREYARQLREAKRELEALDGGHD
jgi:chromosome segregation ATPase